MEALKKKLMRKKKDKEQFIDTFVNDMKESKKQKEKDEKEERKRVKIEKLQQMSDDPGKIKCPKGNSGFGWR